MSKPLIVIATEEERKLISSCRPDLAKCKVIVTGIGSLNVVEKLKKVRKNRTIINIGYVGSNILSVGHIVEVKKVQLFHPNCNYLTPSYVLQKEGVECYSSCDFVTFTKIKKPAVFDMELAFICSLGFKKVISYKIVSDNLSLKQYDKTIGGK